MAMHLQRQIDRLKRMILKLGAVVEQSVEKAILALQTRDAELAEQVIREDRVVDQMELEVEEECLHTLACDQPVAYDLRFVVSVLKINNDLERIADLAVNMAEQCQFLCQKAPLDPLPFDVDAQAQRVRAMLHRSLDALVNGDVQQAQWVCRTDDLVDQAHRRLIEYVIGTITEQPRQAPQLIHFLSVSRQLERIADHACNIAEDVIYMIAGENPRHRSPAPPPEVL